MTRLPPGLQIYIPPIAHLLHGLLGPPQSSKSLLSSQNSRKAIKTGNLRLHNNYGELATIKTATKTKSPGNPGLYFLPMINVETIP